MDDKQLSPQEQIIRDLKEKGSIIKKLQDDREGLLTAEPSLQPTGAPPHVSPAALKQRKELGEQIEDMQKEGVIEAMNKSSSLPPEQQKKIMEQAADLLKMSPETVREIQQKEKSRADFEQSKFAGKAPQQDSPWGDKLFARLPVIEQQEPQQDREQLAPLQVIEQEQTAQETPWLSKFLANAPQIPSKENEPEQEQALKDAFNDVARDGRE